MLFLVNDILDFAQLEDNKIVLNLTQDVNLCDLIADCLEVLRFKSESKGLKLDYKVSEELLDRNLMTDANRLK